MPKTLSAKKLREMSEEDLRAKLKELRHELMHERGVASMGGAPVNPGRIRSLKRQIARILTVLREKEVGNR